MIDIVQRGKSVAALIRKNWLLAAALAVGLIILCIPSGGRDNPPAAAQQESPSPEFDLEREEKRIAAALSGISGAKDVKVTLTLECGAERELAKDEKTGFASDRGEREETLVKLQNGSGRQEAVILKYNYPKYRGALVTAKGAGAELRLRLTEAVAALTGLTSDKITVA